MIIQTPLPHSTKGTTYTQHISKYSTRSAGSFSSLQRCYIDRLRCFRPRCSSLRAWLFPSPARIVNIISIAPTAAAIAPIGKQWDMPTRLSRNAAQDSGACSLSRLVDVDQADSELRTSSSRPRHTGSLVESRHIICPLTISSTFRTISIH